MDVQKVRPDDIITVTSNISSFDLTGKVCVPVSWLYFQMRESNIAAMSIEELQSSLGGRVCLDVMLNAKKDEKHLSTLRYVDLCVMNLQNGIDKFYNFGDAKVIFMVEGVKVNVINFAHKLCEGLVDYREPDGETCIRMDGSFANELDFNEHMLMMVKPYKIKLKKPTLLHDSSEFFA